MLTFLTNSGSKLYTKTVTFIAVLYFLKKSLSMKRFCTLILMFVLLSTACNKDKQSEVDRDLIEGFLSENNIEAEVTDEGVYYVITEEGSGETNPTLSSTVEVKYKGYLLDGNVFDETTGSSTIEFPLTNLIRGWQIGIPLLTKGGKGTFYIPSELGYGDQQVGTIPRNSVLVFDIELVDFE